MGQVLYIYFLILPSCGHTSCYCALLDCASQVLPFLQIEGNTLHRQKDYNPLYCLGLELNPQCLLSMPVSHALEKETGTDSLNRWSTI